VVQRARGRELVARAGELDGEARERRAAARDRRATLEEARKGVPEFAPVDEKRGWWALEDEVRGLEREATFAEAERDRLLQTALHLAPELPEAHAALADGYHRRHLEAELAGAEAEAAVLEGLLRAHDTARHFRGYLEGTGTLRLRVDAPGAWALLARVRELDRRLVPTDPEALELPAERALAHGSWLVTAGAPGRATVRLPVWLGRGDVWTQELTLPPPLPDDACLVPAGPFWAGGDPEVPCLPRRRLWVDAFVIDRHPVTNARFLQFLDDLVRRGREPEALRWAPRERAGTATDDGSLIYGRTADGGFCLRKDADGDEWRPDLPVLMVDWSAARAFAAWEAERSGLPWRLPTEFEWEKAARGVDGRRYPWGNHPDATWMCIRASHATKAEPPPVGAFPLDESPYGVRGMAGGVRDWCLDLGAPQGPPTDGDRVVVPDVVDDDPELPRAYRGGDWYGLAVHARAAYRAWNKAKARNYSLGFRLCRSTTG
jgi:formylglycine-generating enzyme required for sulfatase activity